MNEKKNELQMSEAFLTSIFLAVSGGFQDAYTYNTREEVFSNAQPGSRCCTADAHLRVS